MRCCYTTQITKWTFKIVDIPRNCKIEMVASCSMTDGNGICHGLAPSFFEEMKRCRCQKHCWRWPGNHYCWSKFRNIAHTFRFYVFTSSRSRLLLRSWRQRQLPWTRTVVFWKDDTLPTSKTSLAMTRIDRNLCVWDQARPLEKHFFLLLGHRRYDSIAHWFFPTITRNGLFSVTSHLWKIISRRPWTHQNIEIYIEEFFL